jgi:hypothetical protein
MKADGDAIKPAKSHANYDNRLIVYLDILGFQEAIANTVDKSGNDNGDHIANIADIFELIKTHWRVGGDAKISQFSDLIVLSLIPSEHAVLETLFMLQIFILRLMHKGFLCRGAMKYGKLIHTNEFVFGPVLVEAYREETKHAKFPRIVFSPELFQVASDTERDFYCVVEDKIKRD